MMEKNQIESFLRINGLSLHSDDEDIKELLKYSKWDECEIDELLEQVRKNVVTVPTSSQVAYRAINSDKRLDPDMINSILGVEMYVKDTELIHSKDLHRLEPSSSQMLEIITYSLLMAVMIIGIGFGILYFDITLPV